MRCAGLEYQFLQIFQWRDVQQEFHKLMSRDMQIPHFIPVRSKCCPFHDVFVLHGIIKGKQ
jgi:hypothetical protein